MPLVFEEVYRLMKLIGPDIGKLMKRGDKMARDVVERYRDWYLHEGEVFNKWAQEPLLNRKPLPDTRRRRSLVSAVEQYMQRDLTISEREKLKGEFGHLIQDRKADADPRFTPEQQISNSVRNAIRGLH